MTLDEIFKEIKQKLLSETRNFYGPRLVSLVIFGSVARGTQRPDSDLDVLIIAEELPDGRIKRVREFEEVESRLEEFLKSYKKYGVSTYISPVIKTPQETEIGSPLFLDMVEDAEILFDRDDFFQKRIDRLRKRLEELGSKRIWSGNSWYWVLKPDYKPGEVFEL